MLRSISLTIPALALALMAGCGGGAERATYLAEFEPDAAPAKGEPVALDGERIGEVGDERDAETRVGSPRVTVELELNADAPPLHHGTLALVTDEGGVVLVDERASGRRRLPKGGVIGIELTTHCSKLARGRASASLLEACGRG